MKNILLLEDEEVLGQIYKKNLEKVGFIVNWQKTVKQAQYAIKSFSPDIALLDHGIRGEELSGIEFTKEIKKQFPHSKVFILSNYSKIALHEQFVKSKADDFFLKLEYTPRILSAYLSKLFL